MLGNHFFVIGRDYKVITHRPDTHHVNHFFESGDVVTCVDVTPIGRKKTVLGHRDFRRDHLVGMFVRKSDGIDQALATGDVKCLR